MIKNNKNAQESFQLLSRKSGQEEMVGFALIIVIVAIILVVLLSFYIRSPQEERTGSPEANSFLQAVLQYTTDCEVDLEMITIQKLIYQCDKGEDCSDGSDPCVLLKRTLEDILEASWGKINPNNPEENLVKGYSFIILKTEGNIEKEILEISEGVVTNNYKGGDQALPPNRGNWDNAIVIFDVYN